MLPLLAERLRGRLPRVGVAPAGASSLPRFDVAGHLAALAQDPPAWPARTDAASLLALDLSIPRTGLTSALPPQQVRLEFLDYPGEWLLDLPLLRQDFAQWSDTALRQLEPRAEAAEFLSFAAALPAGIGADEAMAATGHRLYRALLGRLRDAGLALLQPGRFLMPAPGPEPAWMGFFPLRGHGGLHDLLARRYAAYTEAVQRDLSDPLFGQLDRMVVLVDLLSALHAGPDAFQDLSAALKEASASLRWERDWLETAMALGRLQWPAPVLSRVAFAATKADHVAERQRGNLAALLRTAAAPEVEVRAAYFALAAVRCTEDIVMTVGDHALSAVRGRRIDGKPARSYPGEVPDRAPGPDFWAHPFLQLPQFEPVRPPDAGRGGRSEHQPGCAAAVPAGRSPMTPEPFFELEEQSAPRLEAEAVALAPDRAPRLGSAVLALGGASVLGLGFAALGAVNFVVDQFARSIWLGWVTLAVALAGFALLGAGIWRELRALFALRHVDRLRADLRSGEAGRITAAARAWATEADPALLPALRTINDPDAALALLRAGPGHRLREAAETLGRTAAVQVVAGIAAMPSPSLDVALVAWRGVRLVRQVAALYGMRPGLFGTLALLRRTALSATLVGAVEFAGNTAAHALLSSPLLARALGEVAGASVAARRMLVLARAVASACDPLTVTADPRRLGG